MQETEIVSGRSETSVTSSAAIGGEGVKSLPDEQLIELFLNDRADRAEAAFRAMVVRHGPMVLGVCRHILNQYQDAEDAFQATFVVLARKAGSIHDRRVLARWLYEVAYRIAVRAKTNAMRRRTLERQGVEMAVTAPEYEAGWNELRPVLHEEVNRLPEKYRTPVVLCYLEGRTNEEVAQLLKWPVGTVKGRLSRARELLRTRLTRRGLVLSAAFLTTALSHEAVFAEVVPSRLIDSTVRAALTRSKWVAGSGRALKSPAQKHALAAQVGIAAALLIVIGTALAGVASRLSDLFPPAPAAPVSPAPVPPPVNLPAPAAPASSCSAPRAAG